MNNVDYKFYQNGGGQYEVLPGGGYISPDLKEVDFNTFKQGASQSGFFSSPDGKSRTFMPQFASQNDAFDAGYHNGGFVKPGQDTYSQLLAGGGDVANAIRAAEGGGQLSAGALVNGNYTTNDSLKQDQAHQAAVASGTEKVVGNENGVNIYAPTGSEATKQPFSPTGSMGASQNPQTANTPQAQGIATTSQQSYTVKAGDSIGKIAQMLGVNPSAISGYKSGNPNLIYPGENLTITKPAIQTQGAMPTGGATGTQGQTGQTGTDAATPEKSLTQQTIDTYKEIYNSLGLGDIKSQYEKTLKDQADLQNKMNDDIMGVQNNPWLAQGIRDKEIENVKKKYETKLDILTNQAKLYDSLFQQGQQEVNQIAGDVQQSKLKALEIAEKQQEALNALGKDNQITEANGRVLLVNKSTGKTVSDLGAAKVAGSGTGGTSNAQIDNERALFNQFNGEPIVKDYNTILAKKLSVDKILNSKLGGPGDLATVYEFMKALDPTSVVRETEYASAAKSGNIFAGTLARFNGYLKPEGGFLPDQVKFAFMNIINSKLDVQEQLYNNVASQYQGVAQRQGLNPQNVTVNYSAANTKPSASSFDSIAKDITIKGQNAYIPRSVWATVKDKDGLLNEAKKDGYTLLIND